MNNMDARQPTPQAQGPPDAAAPGSAGAAGNAQQPVDAFEVNLEAIKLTDVGRARPHNEDYVDSYIPPDRRQLERKGALYLLADGMGGHQAGEVASQGAVELVIGQYYSDTTHDIGTSLVRAFRAANQLIYDQAQADPSKAGMGTTLVAAVILGRQVYLANVGDSRAYLVNKGGITQISEDHSWVEEQVRAGLLTQEQASRHPQRNLLTRALGTKPDVKVDLFEGELGEGDMLLLCSDGLTGRVEDREIAAMVTEHSPEEAARLLVALANERGGNDNITVLLVGDRPETTTVAVPPPVPVAVPIKEEPKRAFPLIPVLVGLAGVLVLILGGLLVAPMILRREDTPTPTVQPSAATTSVPTPADLEPTETLAVTQASVDTPSVEAEETSSEPTATLAATFTPLPPTSTPRPPGPTTSPPTSPSVSSTATSEPADAPPTLEQPMIGDELRGEVLFRWSYPVIPSGKGFQVLIWKEGEALHNGAAQFTRQRQQTIDVDQVPQVQSGGAGTYRWTVVVVDMQTEQRLSSEPASRSFYYAGPAGPGGPDESPGGDQPGGDQPGSDQPGSDQPGGDQQGQ